MSGDRHHHRTEDSVCCSGSRRATWPGAGTAAEGVFVVCALAALLLWRKDSLFRTLSVTFSAIVLEALPFMLLGSLAGGLVEVFVSRERMTKLIPVGKRGVFCAAGLGLVFPICECAVVPVVRRLIGKGVSPAAALAYLLSGPIANPIVFLSTGTAYSFQWSTALIRVACGYGLGVSISLLLQWLFQEKFAKIMLRENTLEEEGAASCGCGSDHGPHGSVHGTDPKAQKSPVWDALAHGADDFLDAGRFLVMGAFAAALIHTVLPRGLLAGLTGSPVLSIVSAMAMAVGLNLCSEADAFVAASMRYVWPFAAQMAFMLLGPMLDIKLLFMYRGLFRGRFVAVLATIVAVFVFLVAFDMHFFFKGENGG